MLTLSIKIRILSIIFFVHSFCLAQIGWTWTELDTMPFPISNNAVTSGIISGQNYVYSFGGIDTTKIFSGITQRSFRYNVSTDIWDEIAPLPSSLENIAAAASTVNNKIYIIGGYHVYSTGNEISSNEVIIYNPETNSYEPNGASIPTPIDDQVQCVWRDSLIFVITGWSNSTNVTKVQIYDPALDQWQSGTDLPNSASYKVFGGSGEIIGDTIYYFGGASTGSNFPAQNKLRKGIIDPNDPTQIIWSIEEVGPNNGYRQACIKYGTNIFWIGGSSTSYNYDGIAYNGTGGVEPLTQIMRLQAYYQYWDEGIGSPYGVMDLRGAAQVSPTEWIICGGMKSGQQVSNRTFLLTYDPIVGGINEQSESAFQIINRQINYEKEILEANIYSLDGKMISSLDKVSFLISSEINGVVIVEVITEESTMRKKVVL